MERSAAKGGVGAASMAFLPHCIIKKGALSLVSFWKKRRKTVENNKNLIVHKNNICIHMYKINIFDKEIWCILEKYKYIIHMLC